MEHILAYTDNDIIVVYSANPIQYLYNKHCKTKTL